MKKRIRLTEGDLHNIIRKCVNEALNETIEMQDFNGQTLDDFEDAYYNGDYERCKQLCDYIDAYGLWGSLKRRLGSDNLEDALDKAYKN